MFASDIISSITDKCPKQSGKRPHRLFVTPRGDEGILTPSALEGTFARGSRRTLRSALIRRYSGSACPLKSAASRAWRGSGPPFKVSFLESAPYSFSIASAVFAQLIRVPNKHTDTQTTLRTTSVAIGRSYALRAGDVD